MIEEARANIRIKSMTEAVDSTPTVLMDWPNNKILNQILSKVEYVILDDNYKTTHKPFFCKDYFNEIIATEIDGKSREQYGFISSKLDFNILDRSNFKLALICKNSVNIEQYIQGLLALLNKADKNRGFELTTIEETTDKQIIVLTIDTNWLKVPVYLSLYTLLIRLAYNYTNEDFKDYIYNIYDKIDSTKQIKYGDISVSTDVKDYIIYLFEGGKVLQKWEDCINHTNIILHNNSGVIGYFNKYNKDLNKLKEDVEQNTKEIVI